MKTGRCNVVVDWTKAFVTSRVNNFKSYIWLSAMSKRIDRRLTVGAPVRRPCSVSLQAATHRRDFVVPSAFNLSTNVVDTIYVLLLLFCQLFRSIPDQVTLAVRPVGTLGKHFHLGAEAAVQVR